MVKNDRTVPYAVIERIFETGIFLLGIQYASRQGELSRVNCREFDEVKSWTRSAVRGR